MLLFLKGIVQKVVLSQAFITVIAGVGVFALSQWIIITVTNPYQTYLKAASDLSREMLKLTYKFTNFSLNENEQENIRNVNAAYLAAVWNSGWFRRKKRRKNGFKVAQCINGIIGASQPSATGTSKGTSIEDISRIEKLDRNLKIQYSSSMNGKKWIIQILRKKGSMYNA